MPKPLQPQLDDASKSGSDSSDDGDFVPSGSGRCACAAQPAALAVAFALALAVAFALALAVAFALALDFLTAFAAAATATRLIQTSATAK